MHRWILVLIATVSTGLVAHVRPAAGAYLESDYGTAKPAPGKPIVAPPPRPAPVPPVRVVNEATRLLDRVRVHSAVHFGGLTVFPLTAHPQLGWPYRSLLTLREALVRGCVEIRELDRPAVEHARFINRSDAYIFVMGGEVIVGGKQNRVVRHDALLAPRSDSVLPLYCVQQGRWDKAGGVFRRSPSCLPPELRTLAAGDAGQNAVWEAVRSAIRRLGVQSVTEDFQAGLDAPEITGELARCRRRIGPKLPPGCIGLVVARFGRIIGADLFVDANLFAGLRDKVLDSYGQSVLRCGVRQGWRSPTPADAKRFLDPVYRARFTDGPVRGVGRIRRIHGAASGHALVFKNRCLHLNLTASRIVPAPLEKPGRPAAELPRHGD